MHRPSHETSVLRSVCWFPAQRQGPVPATSQRLDHANHRHSRHVKHKEGCTFPSVGPLTSCRHRGSNERISNPWPPFISNQICSLFSWKESQAGHQEDPPSLSVKASCQEGHPFCRLPLWHWDSNLQKWALWCPSGQGTCWAHPVPGTARVPGL